MMIKRFVAIIALIGLAGQVTSCTSKEGPSDSELSADLEAADLEQIENADSVDVASDDPIMSEALTEDALGESAAASNEVSETSVTTETVTTTTENTMDDTIATTEQVDVATSEQTLPADPFGDSSADVMTESTSSSTTVTEEAAADETVESTPGTYADGTTTRTETIITETKKNIPLQKMADTPWTVGGTLYNTVYFARPGDSLDSISSMIYGVDKTADLKKGNPTFQSRGVKPGDKVYYNSPNRPTDNTRVITYYEDNGIAPEVYVAQAGDNIRTVSSKLVGHGNGWKEVWSSNDVESKGSLAAGTQLRYWKGGGQAVAQNQAAPPSQIPQPPAMAEVPETMPPMDMTPPPTEDPMMAANDIPPPPMGDMGAPPPPPPMDDFAQDMAPPPPPPVENFNPPAPEQNVADVEGEGGMDSETTMALGVVCVAAIGLAVLMVVRKKRKQKELEQQALDQTHVGT